MGPEEGLLYRSTKCGSTISLVVSQLDPDFHSLRKKYRYIESLNHSGLDSPQLAAFVIPAEAGIQFFMSGFPPTRE